MDEKKIEEVFRRIDGWGGEMVDFLTMLVSLPAIGPASGGTGESKKVDAIKDWLTRTGFADQRSFDAPDARVPSGIRPNLTVWLRGRESRRRLLIITHTDVVPPGNLDQWDSDPFKAVEKDGKLYGRGTEDNGQSITSSLFAARALMELELVPVFDVGLVLVADEENDNEKGIAHLLAQDLFREGDLVVVADHGEPDGMLIEVSEKSLAWVKVTTRGKQCHSSLPDLGKNAFRAAMDFWHLAEHTLGERFPMRERTFDHPISTFEPTKKEVNVENVNTIPGEDVFYMDCRLLPPYTNDELMAELRAVADEVQREHGVTIDIEFILREDAPPPTDPGSEVVLRLGRVVEQVRGKRPRIGGIGGSTTAASMRRAGFPAVAWETILNTAHSPNEHILVDNMVEDCKVFAALYLQDDLSP